MMVGILGTVVGFLRNAWRLICLIVKKHPKLETGRESTWNLIWLESLTETSCNVTQTSINYVFGLISLAVGVYEEESEALQLLKTEEKLTSEKVVQTLQLQKLISEFLDKLDVEAQNIMRGSPNTIKRGNGSASEKHDQALQLQKRMIKREMGNTKFLVELIRRYPHLMWKLGSMKDLITSLRDVDENNMLHLAGKSATIEQRRFNTTSIVQKTLSQLQHNSIQFAQERTDHESSSSYREIIFFIQFID
ncbi:hypothetical protein QVD17_37059 [Tagetes erecta]|uniref:Uncharacterized protein n=1 Tax=Tagetes erecta TaxID=13708 RepID=A0AAD8NIV0_TARER|nr:hypothetical protein QVD17_37059 [Tagetes erecta]